MADYEFQKRTYRVTRELIYGQIATVATFALICFGAYHIDGCSKRAEERRRQEQPRPEKKESRLEKDVRTHDLPPAK